MKTPHPRHLPQLTSEPALCPERRHRTRAVLLAIASAAALAAGAAHAQSELTPDSLRNATGSTAEEAKLSYVRETALRETAMGLGTRLGLMQRSRELIAQANKDAARLDKQYPFNALMMGPGVLPPVILESQELVSLEATTMRVAGAAYEIFEPARFVAVAPTWRDWLFLGLVSDDPVDMNTVKPLLPRDSNEKAFWQKSVDQAIQNGRAQADQIFALNAARLDKTFDGMKAFFRLWKAGYVTAPVVASSQSMVDRESPNSISVGNTMFRITQQSSFQAPDRWKPLE